MKEGNIELPVEDVCLILPIRWGHIFLVCFTCISMFFLVLYVMFFPMPTLSVMVPSKLIQTIGLFDQLLKRANIKWLFCVFFQLTSELDVIIWNHECNCFPLVVDHFQMFPFLCTVVQDKYEMDGVRKKVLTLETIDLQPPAWESVERHRENRSCCSLHVMLQCHAHSSFFEHVDTHPNAEHKTIRNKQLIK